MIKKLLVLTVKNINSIVIKRKIIPRTNNLNRNGEETRKAHLYANRIVDETMLKFLLRAHVRIASLEEERDQSDFRQHYML